MKFAEGQFQAKNSFTTEKGELTAIINSLDPNSKETPKLVLGPKAFLGECIGTQWFFKGNDLTLSADIAPRFKPVMEILADTKSGESWKITMNKVIWRSQTGLAQHIVFNAGYEKIIVPKSFNPQYKKCKRNEFTTITFENKTQKTVKVKVSMLKKSFP